MEEIVNYIKNNNDIDKTVEIIFVLLFNAIYNKYPTSNAIAIINTLYNNNCYININILDIISYDILMPIIKKNNNDILHGYFVLLYDHYEKKNNINELIIMFNKYKFKTENNITIETFKPYITTILKPYIDSHFDNKFSESINIPSKLKSWQDIHRAEIIDRLTSIMQLFNKNICKLCNIKVQHINTINNLSFDELTEYFFSCALKIRTKIDYICEYIDLYEILDNNIKKIIEHNANYINDDENINEVIFENIETSNE